MKILLGVSGGIAAYKAVELLRLLQTCNVDVDVEVAMTRSAQRFVTPLTFAALTGRPVFTSLWQQPEAQAPGGEAFPIEHIAAGQDIDALVIVPATANLLARFAHGLTNDFLSALYLATTAPVLVAPAMNVNMWQHPATETNLATLAARGVRIVAPDAGYLACGMTGSGRLAPIESIAEAVLSLTRPRHDLAGETVLVTAGGTREPIDPVRFLGNRSSGKMGHALAAAAAARGARVRLVTASALPPPPACELTRVDTAAEMERAVLHHLGESTIVIQAAAVADYRSAAVSSTKLRRDGPLTLELLPTRDIIAAAAAERRSGTLLIAFAAESAGSDARELEAQARAKLLRKGVDAIVANDISLPGLGMESDRNAGLFVTAHSAEPLPESSKATMAERILDQVVRLRAATQTHTLADALAATQTDT